MKTWRSHSLFKAAAFSIWPIFLLTIFLIPELVGHAQTKLKYDQPTNASSSAAQPSTTYMFNGKAGDKLMIVMNAIGGDMDPQIAVYNPAGRLIAEDDNSGGKQDALLRGVVLPSDGVYKLVASNRRNADGKYSLLLKAAISRVPTFFEGEVAGDKEEFQLSRPWPRNQLTYYVANTLPGYSAQDTRAVISEAFQAWANVVPLTFTAVNTDASDIHIQFSPIDGEANVLGQACPPTSPCSGQVEFDSGEHWVLRDAPNYTDISFLAVATHEFGHIIGLLHSSDTSALMYATYSSYNLKPGPDDIRGAQNLYNAGTGRVNGGENGPSPQGSAVQGTISDDKFVTYWDFDVNAGETVTITMRSVSGNLDGFLVLLDANNRILAYADDSNGTTDAVLSNIKLPQTGTYTVATTRYKQAQGYTVGDYELSIDYH